MIHYDFTRQAEQELLKLPPDVQRRIVQKLEHYLSQPNPLRFARRIAGSPVATYRFRIGDFRAIFDWEGTRVLVLRVGHRRDVYRA